MTYHSTTHALRRPIRQSFRGFGLGTVAAITGVPPNVSSAAVRALQQDLVTLGLLPASGVDGYIGTNTTTAVAQAIYSLGLPQDATTAVTHTINGYVTVPPAVLNAIHAAAMAGTMTPASTPTDNGGSTTPAAKPPLPASTSTPASTPSDTTTFLKSLVTDVTSGGGQGPGTTAPLTTTGPLATTSPSSTVKWVLIGGGVLTVAALTAVLIVSRKKTATVAANRRRRMRRNMSVGGHQVDGLRHIMSGDANLSYEKKKAKAHEMVARIGRENVPGDLLERVDRLNNNGRMRRNAEEQDAEELVLYITNDSDLYHRQAQPIIKNLAKKMLKAEDKRAGRGVYKYDHALAAKAWGYLAESGAKKYAKDVAGSGTWHQMFDVATRNEAAKDLADYYLEEVQDVAEAMLQDRIRRLGKNPLPRGYSKKTFGKVIGIERAHGKSRSQAAAIAYRSARSAAKKAHVRPSYLRSNMDPKAALDLAERSIKSGDVDDASDALTSYANWRRNGGFQPPGGDARAAKLGRALSDRQGGRGHGLRRNGGYELVYSTGGTGGPYQDIQSAKDRAQGMIEHSRERWIGIVPAAEITNLHQAQAPWIVHRDEEDRVYWEKGPTYLPFSYFRERMRANRRTG